MIINFEIQKHFHARFPNKKNLQFEKLKRFPFYKVYRITLKCFSFFLLILFLLGLIYSIISSLLLLFDSAINVVK